ncbi:hypothetical protein ACH5RR_024856 [Cinchona calisaya]|uniref:Sey1/RHD3-like three-helix bundle domain-containing protein n=1 Tax=Cinchona calisaya TaxID=153742 RepID=A0ABD2Z0J7_9GENT
MASDFAFLPEKVMYARISGKEGILSAAAQAALDSHFRNFIQSPKQFKWLEKELKKLKAAQKAEAAKLQVEDVACLALRRRKNNLKSRYLFGFLELQLSLIFVVFYGKLHLFLAAVLKVATEAVILPFHCTCFHDIGRQQAANKLLVKTVFRALLENLEPVLREELEPVLREDIQKIWDSVPKPQAHKETPLSEFFSVEVVALSSFEEKEEQFKEQVLVWNNSSGFLWEAAPVLYDAEANYFDEGVRTGKRKQLEEKLLQLVQPAFQLMLGHIWSGTLERFKEAFNDALNGGKGFAITARRCTETSISQLGVVEAKAKEEAGTVLIHMKYRFSTLFSHDTDSMLRVWTWKEDIRAIIKTARSSALKLLSVMEAILLDDVVDNIEKTLSLVLLDSKGSANKNSDHSCPVQISMEAI